MLTGRSGRLSRLLASLRAAECSAAGQEGLVPTLQQIVDTRLNLSTTSAAAATPPASGGGSSSGSAACTTCSGGSSSSSGTSNSTLYEVPQRWQHRLQKTDSSGILYTSRRCRWLSSSSSKSNTEEAATADHTTGSAGGDAAAAAVEGSSTEAADAARAADRGTRAVPAAAHAGLAVGGAANGAQAGLGAAVEAAAGSGGAAPTYQGPAVAGWQNRVWPKPPRQPADLPLFPLGPEELATLDYLQARVRMSEAEAEQALARMCTLYETRQQRTRRLVFSFEKQVKPTIEYLAGLPGLNLKQCISAYPTILVKGTVSELDRRLLRLRNRLGLTAAECSKLLSKSPHTLLTGDLDGRIFPFLDGLEALGFSREEVKAMVLRVSTLLLFSVGKLHDRVAWLKGLGMSLDDVRAVVWKFPTVVCHTSSNCEACLQWMQQLGVPREECAIIIRRLPPVITYSAQKRARFLDFMRDEVGLDDAGIARILRHTPDTLGRAVERLRHNLVQLEAFGMNPDQIRRLVVTNPSVLRMDISSPTYRNKLKYLQEELQVEDPVDAVVSCPFYLSYRLDRIVLRAEYLKAIGASYTSIAAWLAMSERRFCEKWAGTSVAQFRAWAAEWQHSPQGRHWLQLASERNSLMHTRRVLLEAAADAASDKEARVEMEEAAAEAAEHARRHREAQRLFQRQAARAAEERKGQHSREQLRLEQLEEELQRQAAQVEQSAQHWEQQAERLLRLARTAAGEQEPLTEQAAI